MDFTTYRRHDATSLAAEVAAGRVAPRTLLGLALTRLADVQPRLNPVCRLMEAEARAQLAHGDGSGPLAGVPFLIKDAAQDYAGLPTSLGSRALAGLPPSSQHAHVVRRFLAAGLVVFGKTNTPELALKGVTDPLHFGRSSNPWDPHRTPGGSSGGAAAAVAAGVVPMAAGNDGGGSIRIPAACCGLVGLKPSRGRVSVGPGQGEVWFGASSEGVLSRSVRDTALALDVLCGPEPGDPVALPAPATPFVDQMRAPLRRLRIAWCTDSPIGEPVHDEARLAVERTVALLKGLGHVVEPAR
ncbi:MAG: amidase, partial [Burkholderiales bacterium]|nr:amidase [Burkholderiales bacterium]